jgi:hypothetical protein
MHIECHGKSMSVSLSLSLGLNVNGSIFSSLVFIRLWVLDDAGSPFEVD